MNTQYTIKSASYVEAIAPENTLLVVQIIQAIDGKTWGFNRTLQGEEAVKIWSIWGPDNDQEIINQLLA